MSVSGLIHIQKLCWLLGSQVPVLFDHSKLGPGFDLSRWQGFPQKKTDGEIHNWRFPSMGVPQTGWVVMENPIENGWFGGTPIQEPLNCNWILVPCIEALLLIQKYQNRYGKCSRIGARWWSNSDPSWPFRESVISQEASRPISKEAGNLI